MTTWQPIETAPKDGRIVLLLSAGDTLDICGETIVRPPRVALGKWCPEGTSWVDENGQLGGECYELAETGVWESGTGWFQPNEVTAWAPIPELPVDGESVPVKE